MILLPIVLLLGVFAVGVIVGRAGDDGGVSRPGADCSGKAADQEKSRPPQPVVRFAPVVFLHPQEPYKPMSVECFLANAHLYWARRKGSIPTTGDKLVDASHLGQGQYQQSAVGGACLRAQCIFSSKEFTRPWDESRRTLLGRPGFYLDVEDPFRAGAETTLPGAIFTGTPAYYDYVPRRYVTYWFFYGFSEPFGALRLPRQAKIVGHEGDWERISIRLNRANEATKIFYSAHHGGKPYNLPSLAIATVDDHPVVFSALKSHASYATQGRKGDLDRAAPGYLWLTWQSLEDVRCAPWFGFGGAWGIPRKVPSSIRALAEQRHISLSEAEFTGPLGPSSYKRPAPKDWMGKPNPARCNHGGRSAT